MTKYKLRYTTPYGLQIFQEFPDKESRDGTLLYKPGGIHE